MQTNNPAGHPRQDATECFPADLFGWIPSPPIAPDDPPTYPQVAGFKGSAGGPSAVAAKIINLNITGRRAEVLEYLRTRVGPETADEIAAGLERSILSIRPRVAELHKLGLIEPAAERGTNESGMSAHRWRAKAVQS